MSDAMTYEQKGQDGGFKVCEAHTGWVVESWSTRAGSTTGRKVLVPYGVGGYHRGAHLDGEHNDYCTIGEFIAREGIELGAAGGVKVIRKGHKVQ